MDLYHFIVHNLNQFNLVCYHSKLHCLDCKKFESLYFIITHNFNFISFQLRSNWKIHCFGLYAIYVHHWLVTRLIEISFSFSFANLITILSSLNIIGRINHHHNFENDYPFLNTIRNRYYKYMNQPMHYCPDVDSIQAPQTCTTDLLTS